MDKQATSAIKTHPFVKKPNVTFLLLSLPVLFSMVAEPITGLVDTAFIATLGSTPLAALGVGTMLLSSMFWVFNFLSVGSQTEVGQALGRKEHGRAAEIGYLALLVGFLLGTALIPVCLWLVPTAVSYMGATGNVYHLTIPYVSIRLFGAPAILVSLAAFGILRGMQDMRTPLWIAVLVNALNIVLDGVLIFGLGPFPALGITGAALATIVSQWIGAAVIVIVVYVKLGRPSRLKISDIRRLFQIGGDMFIRTGLLLLYLMMATRTATRISDEAGAAHQAIRQFWTFTALFLDAYSVTAQSLIAFFVGQEHRKNARQVVRVICLWSFVTGCLLIAIMLGGQPLFIRLFVPEAAIGFFIIPWWIAAVSQPVNSIAFATDGIHWGTGDFAYLRNGMIVATAVGLVGLRYLETSSSATLEKVWLVTVVWITVRSVAGVIRIWPGIGRPPLRETEPMD